MGFFFSFFLMCTILKVFIEFVTSSVLCFVFFGREVCGILAPQPGMEPVLSALEDNVLTSGLPGKSLSGLFQVLNLSPEPPSPLQSHTVPPLGGQDANHLSNSRLQSIFMNWKRIQIVSTLKKKIVSTLTFVLTQEQLVEAAPTNVVENGSRRRWQPWRPPTRASVKELRIFLFS